MTSISRYSEADSIIEIWQRFQETGEIDSNMAYFLNPLIQESWQRSRQIFGDRLSPFIETGITSSLPIIPDDEADLMTISLPHLEDIYQSTKDADCVVLIANHEARVLAYEGNRSVINIMERLGLRVGEIWSEATIGTSAIGLSLVTAMPTEVHGAEHYLRQYHTFSTAAAPIYDEDGVMTGLIGLVSLYQDSQDYSLALVMSVAQAITSQLQTNMFIEQANEHLRQMNTILEAVTDGILTWSIDGRVDHINQRAAGMLDLIPTTILGKRVTDVIDFPDRIIEAMENEEDLTDVEAKLQAGRRILSCFMTLRPIRSGAFGVTGFVALLRPSSQVRRLVNQQVGTQASLTINDILTRARSFRAIVRQAEVAARASAPVLLLGEAGVGKNALARAIHNAGPRSGKPFLPINCRAIPHELMLEELLGLEGASDVASRPSKFELADGGTLFLEQIDYLSFEMQAILQQVLDTRHILRLGGGRAIPVNVRIIVATTSDIEELVANQAFSSQLYYSLRVFRLEIPPLRKRPEDIPLLANQFLMRFSTDSGQPYHISDAAMEVLLKYPWPGNVREMQGVLERAQLNNLNGTINVTDLPENVRQGRVILSGTPEPQPVLTFSDMEREAIIRAGWAYEGNVSHMADALGVGRTTLWRKMKQFEIQPELFKAD